MCLGIPGRIVSLDERYPDLARVEVAGAARDIHVGMLSGEGLKPGDWVLIHSGLAVEKVDEARAKAHLSFLADYTGGPSEGAERELEP